MNAWFTTGFQRTLSRGGNGRRILSNYEKKKNQQNIDQFVVLKPLKIPEVTANNRRVCLTK